MTITSATFVRGITGPDPLLLSDTPQIAMIGRSNVGKSSVINTLVQKKGLAVTSSTPGRTREINIYNINNAFFLMDLPGYGFARGSHSEREALQRLIYWYLIQSEYHQKYVVLIIDANVGPTANDIETLRTLEVAGKNILIVANKIDKIRPSDYHKQMQKVTNLMGGHTVLPYSAEKKIGTDELREILFGNVKVAE